MTKDCKRFYLGERFPGTYFTPREAEISTYVTQGMTMREVAKHMQLSPRTIEFYLNNMKAKLCVKRKQDLVDILKRHNPLKQNL